MIFALGFLNAGLLALLFLPAFWRRAVRLSTRRLEMLMPLSMDEVIAERDAVRADAAARERRLEQKLEAMNAERAGHMAEIGRRMATLSEREGQLANLRAELEELQRTFATRGEELERTAAALTSAQQEVLALTQRLSSNDEAGRAFKDVEKTLRHEIDQYRTTIAGLETKLAGLEVARNDFATQLQHLNAECADATTLSTQEEQVLRKAISDIGAQILSLSQELNDARQQDEPLDDRIRSLRNRIKQVVG